jgi:hypothetical protein
MKFFFDTEFLEDGSSIDLISIAIIGEDGSEYYACVKDANWEKINKDAWLKQHVINQLPPKSSPEWKTKSQIAKDIIAFVGDHPEFWADFSGYDWVALCQLYGKMIHLPDTWPMFCRDIQQLKELVGIEEFPSMSDNEHNAIVDARETKARFDMCVGEAKKKGIRIESERPSLNKRLSQALNDGIKFARSDKELKTTKFRR